LIFFNIRFVNHINVLKRHSVGTKCSSTDGTREIGRLRTVPSDIRNFCSEGGLHNGSISKSENAANIGEIPRLRRTGFAAESCTVGNAEPARVMIIPSNIASLGADSGFRSGVFFFVS
ncbi:hypothetical protein OESDEN_07668, partial [Oesophagostomum dentatum]